MNITLITPTRNRVVAFSLLQKWIGRQTRKPDQWIVVNDGVEPYDYTCGQEVIVRHPKHGEIHSLCGNLLAALPRVTGDLVVFVEDDDWYCPTYLETMERIAGMELASEIFGCAPSLLYNLRNRSMFNVGNQSQCTLGQTAIRSTLLQWLDMRVRRGEPHIDNCMWRNFGGRKRVVRNAEGARAMHIGFKGMPGEAGIGYGHKEKGLSDTAAFDMLKALIGSADAGHYAAITF